MADLTFIPENGTIPERRLLVTYLNTGESGAPVWSPLGKGVEDSSIEYDWQGESKKDILGITHSTMKPPIMTQTFDPCDLYVGEAALLKLWNLAVKDHGAAKLCNLDMLIVHSYAGTSGKVFAERYDGCMVNNSGLGGSATITMPLNVTYGGNRTTGTAAVSDGTVTFTADT